MDNVTQPAAGGSKTGMWVALIIAVIVLGVGAYFLFARDNGTNTNDTNNTNTATNGVSNANSMANMNGAGNENTNVETNANTSVDTSEWKTYESDEFGFTFRYPDEWKLSEYENGTISVIPRSFQEPTPLLKAIFGGTSEAEEWLNENHTEPGSGNFVRTADTYTLRGVAGPIFRLGGNFYAIIEFENYSAIIYMNVLNEEFGFVDFHYYTEYSIILNTFQNQ